MESVKRTLKLSKREWLTFAAALLLVVLVFVTGIFDRQKVWTDISLDYQNEKTSFSLESGDAHGIIASGPYIDLPPGRYRIKWQLEGDGENVFHLRSTNGVQVSPAEIRTMPGVWQDEAWFEVLGDAHNFAIDVEFAQGSWLKAYNFRLYSPQYTDDAWSFAFLVLAVWLIYVAWRKGYLTLQRRQTVVLLTIAILVVSVPSLRRDATMSIDSRFHMARIMNLADGLSDGQFPVRAGGFSYNGYGAVTSVFYPDLLLYLPAIMILGGASIAYVVNVYCILCHILAAVTMYVAAKRMFKDSQAACCASILYVCALYRLLDVYRRFMAGEMAAMAVMPLFILGLWEVLWGDQRHYPVLILGATLIFRNHILSTLICAGVAVLMGIISLRRLICQRRLITVCKVIIWTLLLNLNVLVPMVTMYISGVTSTPMALEIKNSAMEIWQVVMGNGWQNVTAWIGVAAVFCCDSEQDKKDKLSLARGLAVMGIVVSLMTTEMFPWSHAAKLTGGLIDILQFTSRLLIISAPVLALSGGYGFVRMFNGKSVAGLLVLIIAVFPVLPYIEKVLGQDVHEFGRGANPYMFYPEYQIEGTDTVATRSRDVLVEGEAELTEYRKQGTEIKVRVNAIEDASLSFPLFGFDGYIVELNGRKMNWTLGENNRLMVPLLAGEQGDMVVRFKGKNLWRVSDVISFVSLLGLIICMYRKRRCL